MTLFFDTKVQFLDAEAVSTTSAWHKTEPLFAVASYSQNRGGSVTVFNDQGEPLREITYPVHPISQATALNWHPEKQLLVSGWENGEVYSWAKGDREFKAVKGPHKAPIVSLAFSEQGGRLVSADSMGVLTGWRLDNHHNQFLTAFTHDLRDPVLHITFRRTHQSQNTEMTNLAKAAVAGDTEALDTLTNWRPRTAARNNAQFIGVQDNHCFYVGTQNGILYYVNQQGTCTEAMRLTSSPIVQVLWHPRKDAIVTLMDDMTVAHYFVESSGMVSELDRVKLSGRIPGHNGFIAWTYGNALAIIVGDLSVRIWDIETSDNFLLALELADHRKPGPDLPRGTGVEIFTCLAYCAQNQTICAGTSHGNVYTWHKTNYLTHDSHQLRQSVADGGSAVDALAVASDDDLDEDGRDVVVGEGDATASRYGTSNNNNQLWQLNNVSNVRGAIKQCTWGLDEQGTACILLNCISNVFIMKEQPLIMFHSRDMTALQRTANRIWVEATAAAAGNRHCSLQTEIPITDMALNSKFLVVTNGRKIVVYAVAADGGAVGTGGGVSHSKSTPETADPSSSLLVVKQMNAFNSENQRLLLHDDKIITMDGTSVKILSMGGGVTLQEFTFRDMEGKPIGLDLNGDFLAVFTMCGYVRLYDVSRHEPKLICPPNGTMRTGYDLFDDFGEFILVKASTDGTHLGMLIATENLLPDSCVYIWQLELDHVVRFDFSAVSPATKVERFFTKLPVNFYWDTGDSRLLACEVKCIQQRGGNRKGAAANSNPVGKFVTESQVVVMFVGSSAQQASSNINNRCELRELEVIRIAPEEQLVNLCIPHVVTLKINEIGRIALRDFRGLEQCDTMTRRMVLDFSLNVAQGNMDLAFRSIRSIESTAVWENLAKMCVQTRRLDVAKVCFGHLKRARSARALRLALQDPSLEEDAQVAVLAIELGMIAEAEALYKKCGRFDLLNRLYQASAKYEEAIKIAEQFDRVHLKSTYFKYGEYLRDNGDVKGAFKYFEMSDAGATNVTKMLMDDPQALKQLMQTTTDKDMLNWWAQYIESTGDMEQALAIYQRADDWFSQVRILCFLGQLPKAADVAKQSGDRAACYHLARHYENVGRVSEAIQFYTKAQTYGNAVRICKEHHLTEELWTVGTLARGRDKVSAASYFEDNGEYKRAVELYHRAGMLHKAVEMAFASQQPEILQVIASELDSASDPELVNRCAEFFLSIDQSYKAVQLLSNTHQFERALDVCADKGVPVTATFAEALTPNKGDREEEQRIKILLKLGDILQEQGDYHTATKKFTQAGDKIRAMKCLLKSGDTEKIVFFATMSRQREVYIMAGNYLQALNWQDDAKILKNIVTFYSKGQAFDLLANFYATSAQVEVDEYRDYEKALKALQEANRCVAKIPNAQRTADHLQVTILEVKKMLQLQENLERGECQAVIAGCKNMLAGGPERPPVRHSDVLLMLFEAFVATKQFPEALSLLREITKKVPDWSARALIERETIEKVAAASDLSFESIWMAGDGRYNSRGGADQKDDNGGGDEEIEDEIVEEVE